MRTTPAGSGGARAGVAVCAGRRGRTSRTGVRLHLQGFRAGRVTLAHVRAEHAAGHDELRQQAEEHGKEPMRLRAEANQNAWMEVARVLRAEAKR